MAKVPPEIESDAAELVDILAKEWQRRHGEEMKRAGRRPLPIPRPGRLKDSRRCWKRTNPAPRLEFPGRRYNVGFASGKSDSSTSGPAKPRNRDTPSGQATSPQGLHTKCSPTHLAPRGQGPGRPPPHPRRVVVALIRFAVLEVVCPLKSPRSRPPPGNLPTESQSNPQPHPPQGPAEGRQERPRKPATKVAKPVPQRSPPPRPTRPPPRKS